MGFYYEVVLKSSVGSEVLEEYRRNHPLGDHWAWGQHQSVDGSYFGTLYAYNLDQMTEEEAKQKDIEDFKRLAKTKLSQSIWSKLSFICVCYCIIEVVRYLIAAI